MGHVRGVRCAWKAIVALPVLALLTFLPACAQSGPISRAPDGDPIEAAKALSDAPDLVQASDPDGSCGAFVLGQADSVPTDAVECLSAAASNGASAELAWSFPTTEGDPIVSFAFTGDGADVTVYTTNAFDSYGGDPEWAQRTCDPATATSRTGCPSS